jgi:DNA-binding transcriptional LysR family regulator
MEIRHLARIDLNLLITLQVLLDEGSVSATADKLFLTQPAISKSLSRLREIFDDPLFTRSGRGLVATPLARSLREPLQGILGNVENLFLAETFDPATYKGKFAFAVNEFLDMVLLPRLVEDLAVTAPGILLETYTQLEDQLTGLEKGDLDFVLNLKFSEIPPGFHSDMLIGDEPLVFARHAHPLFRQKKVSFADVLEYPRVALNMSDMDKLSIFTGRVKKGGASPWPSAFETENLITALAVISRTDYLLPGPGLLKHFSSKELHFRAVPVSPGQSVQVDFCLVFHERVARSPAHQWLREKITGLAFGLKI